MYAGQKVLVIIIIVYFGKYQQLVSNKCSQSRNSTFKIIFPFNLLASILHVYTYYRILISLKLSTIL